jgi:esterase
MKLAYREFGTGQPLIILHGLFGQSDNWNTLAKQFAGEGLGVFPVDQRNHGLSPHSDTWNYQVMADDLKEFIEDHNLLNPVILGHSMGGKTALFFEWKYPGIARQLIIADIAPRAYPPHHNEVLAALHAVDFSRLTTRKEAEAKLGEYIQDFGTKQFLLKNIFWKSDHPPLMDWRFDLKTISENYEHIGIGVPVFKSGVKCLVIRGERSEYVMESDMVDFRKRFTDCRLETIAGAGHWVHAEKPKEFFEAVRRFIRENN